jgi:hypothetical protein
MGTASKRLSLEMLVHAHPNAAYEPEGRAECPHSAVGQASYRNRSRRGGDTAPYPPRWVHKAQR